MPLAEPAPSRFPPLAAAPPRRRLPPVEYPVSDGEPMSESGIHWRATVDAGIVLLNHHLDQPNVHVGGNLFMYYEEGNPRAVVSPDVFVAFGPSREPPRDVWKVWEEGKAADFILEVTSKSTKDKDDKDKKRLYERLNVTEYWQFDPTGDYLEPVLKGRGLGADGRYHEFELEQRDGGLCCFSKVLGLDLRLENGRLRFFDPKRGEYLLAGGEQERANQEQRRIIQEQRDAMQEQRDAMQEQRDAMQEQRDAFQVQQQAFQEQRQAFEAEKAEGDAALSAAEARIAELEQRLRAASGPESEG